MLLSKTDKYILEELKKLVRIYNDALFESKHPRDSIGRFAKHRVSSSYTELLENVNKNNKITYSSDQIITNFVKNNPQYSESEIRQKIHEIDEYNKVIADNNLETYKIYSNEKGEYKRERLEEHKKILNEIFANKEKAKPAANEKPVFMVLGGRGGSGKSKFNGRVYDESKYIVLDADKIKEKLPQYHGYNAYEVHKESSNILTSALAKAKKEGLNVVLDGTMKTLKSVEDKIKLFQDAGYDIQMYYMHLPREKAAERAIGRFLGKSGRYVPLNYILNKMKENENNFDKLKHYASKWAIYSNDVPSEKDGPILIDKNY